LRLLNDLLSLKTNAKVPTVRNKQQKKIRKEQLSCGWHPESHWGKGRIRICNLVVQVRGSGSAFKRRGPVDPVS